jgi:hypothetical protein
VRAATRWVIVVIAISSWFAISNHCAITAIAAKTQTAQSSCPFHSRPATPPPKSSGSECCKNLRAITPTPEKNLAPAIIDLLPVDAGFHRLAVLEPPQIFSFELAALDTGPPGKTSFAELSRSLRAHAPPVFA